MESIFSISEQPLDDAVLRGGFRGGRAGAFVCFEGWVREENDGRAVVRLEYEAYRELAEKEGARILREAECRFSVDEVRCVHRVGTLTVGELAVWVGVAAAHRGAAFAACRSIIDEIKQRVPIWKREVYADGESGWLQPDRSPATD